MRILIADDDLKLSSGVARTLTCAGHSVEVVRAGSQVVTRAMEEPVDLVMVDWLMQGLDGMAIVRALHEKLHYRPAVLMTSVLSQPEARAYALKNGVDEYLIKPMTTPGLIAALQAATVAAAKGRAKSSLRPAELRLVTTPFWMSLGAQVTGHIRGCTGILKLEPSRSEPDAADRVIRASLGMLDSEQQLEFDVALSCSRTTGARLAKAMLKLDEPDDAMVTEILSELCNNILGFAKANLRGHGFAFTLSVPGVEGGKQAPAFASVARATLEGAGVRLLLEAGIRAPMSFVVKVGDLKENMVLLEDVKNDQGALLLPAGTRITAAAAERMAHHGSRREVRVAPL